jgi:HEPN domain-containing protein
VTPSRQQKLFRKEYAHELLRIAQGDLQSAVALAGAGAPRPENVIYLAHQALEKALKAVLCWHGVPVPLVHEIGILVAVLPPSLEPPFGYELDALSPFATVRRYLEGGDIITREEIDGTLAQVRAAVDWCQQQVSTAC